MIGIFLEDTHNLNKIPVIVLKNIYQKLLIMKHASFKNVPSELSKHV